MLSTLLQSLLIAWLPGAVLFRLPFGDRRRRAALDADERAFWAVVASVAWSVAVALALAAMGRYRLGGLLAVNALVSLVPVLLFRRRLLMTGEASRPTPRALGPIALVALGLWLFFPPAEYVMGGKDPGTYMNEGIQIAQRGELVIHDPTVAKVPAATRDLFFPSHNNKAYYSTRFMGFFVQDPQQGTVVGQFPHVFPVSIAIGYGLNGLTGARQAVGAWGILGVLAVFFLGARLFGRAPAAAAAALLSISVIDVWFGRYPNAELVMQTLAFSALLAFARAHVDGDRFFAPVAAGLLALLLFARIDAGLVAGCMVAAIALGWLERRRIGPAFWLVLIPAAVLAALYYTRVLTGYLVVPTLFVQGTVPVTALAVAAVVALAAFWGASRVPAASRLLTRAIPVLLALALAALAVHGIFFREAAGKTAWHDAESMRVFMWYVGPYVMTLAVAGVLLLIPRFFWFDPGFFVTASAFALFFFYKIRIVPEHFWMTRRFLPVILPSVMLMAAACAWWIVSPDGLSAALLQRATRKDLPDSRGVRTWRALAIPLMAAALVPAAYWSWAQTARIRHHVEYAGLIPKLEQLAARFADEDLVIVESRNASDLHVLGLPLAYIYAKPVLVLNSPRPDKPMMEAFIADARTKYREVFFLGGGGTDLLTKRMGVEPVGSDRFQVAEYDSPMNAYPAGVERKEFDYGVYRFVDVSALAGEPVTVVGERDDLQVVRFHAKEKDPKSGRTYRWTRDVSYVSLLNVTPGTRTITLWMADGRRPASVERAEVEVSVGETVLGRVTVDGDNRPYTFEVPADIAASAAASDEPVRLRLRSNTWSPRRVLGVPDDRDLGVMLARIEVR